MAPAGKPTFAQELDERRLDVRVERLYEGAGRPDSQAGAERAGWWYVRVRRPVPGAPSTVARSRVLAEAMRAAIDAHDQAEHVLEQFAEPASRKPEEGT